VVTVVRAKPEGLAYLEARMPASVFVTYLEFEND
jgi:hypothetical protein